MAGRAVLFGGRTEQVESMPGSPASPAVGTAAEHAYASPEALFTEQYEPLARAITLISGDADVAREAVQEAFYRLCRDWNTVRSYEHQAAWVRRVALNVVRDQQRSLGRRGRLLARLDQEPAPPLPSDGDPRLWRAVRRLPDKQRTAVGLYYIGDLSVAEIGAAMGVSEGTVKRHLDRARTTLRKRLEVSP